MATTGITKQVNNNPMQGNLPKWVIVAAIWVAGIIGSYFIYAFETEQTVWYQVGLWAAVVISSGFVALMTTQGLQLRQFFKDAQIELRKVVWPSRQEALQATLMVLVAVVVMSLLLWLIDTLLFYLISYISNM